jgi:hypothetical protein
LDSLPLADAARQCAIAGVAVARHRLAHGALPDRLEQLVPAELDEIPTDPFDGGPLRYRRGVSGAEVYSVGPERKEDGELAFVVPGQAGRRGIRPSP